MFKNNPQRFFAMASEGRGGGDANDLPEIKVEEGCILGGSGPDSNREYFTITIGEQNFIIDNHAAWSDRNKRTQYEIYADSLRKKLEVLSLTNDQKKRLYSAVLGAIETFISTDAECLRRNKNSWKLTIRGTEGKRVYETTSERRFSHHTLQ